MLAGTKYRFLVPRFHVNWLVEEDWGVGAEGGVETWEFRKTSGMRWSTVDDVVHTEPAPFRDLDAFVRE